MQPERRTIIDAALVVQHRADGDAAAAPSILRGYAARFDSQTVLHRSPRLEIRETIKPGAFRNSLAANPDVVATFNHSSDFLLGRTTAGTLTLREDDQGLLVEIHPPDTQLARDVVENVRSRNLSKMSFAFLVREGGETTRTRTEAGVQIQEIEIHDVDLVDVAVVTWPAYTSTDVSLRARDLESQIKHQWLELRRAKLARLIASK